MSRKVLPFTHFPRPETWICIQIPQPGAQPLSSSLNSLQGTGRGETLGTRLPNRHSISSQYCSHHHPDVSRSPLLPCCLGCRAPGWTNRLGCWCCLIWPSPPGSSSCALLPSTSLCQLLSLRWSLKSGLLFLCLQLKNQQYITRYFKKVRKISCLAEPKPQISTIQIFAFLKMFNSVKGLS